MFIENPDPTTATYVGAQPASSLTVETRAGARSDVWGPRDTPLLPVAGDPSSSSKSPMAIVNPLQSETLLAEQRDSRARRDLGAGWGGASMSRPLTQSDAPEGIETQMGSRGSIRHEQRETYQQAGTRVLRLSKQRSRCDTRTQLSSGWMAPWGGRSA